MNPQPQSALTKGDSSLQRADLVDEHAISKRLARRFVLFALLGGAVSILVFGSAGVLAGSATSLAVAGTAIAVTAAAGWQTYTARYLVAPVEFAIVLGTSAALFFTPSNMADALGFVIVGTALIGGLVVERRFLWLFLATAVAAFSVHILLDIRNTGAVDELFVLHHTLTFLVLSVGVVAVAATRSSGTRARVQYRHLFSHAPVAILEEDFSVVGPWFAGLRASGVEDLEAYLDERPEELIRIVEETKVRRINPAALRLFGAEATEQPDPTVHTSILSKGGIATFRSQFVAIWDGNDSGSLVLNGERIDGTAFRATVTWSVEPLAGDSPYSRIFMALIDLTDIDAEVAKRLVAEGEYRALTNSIASAVMSVGPDGIIRTWNLHAEELFGYTSSHAIGSPLSMLIPARYREAHSAGLQRLTEGGDRRVVAPIELAALKADGTEFPIELSLGSWERDGDPIYTGVISDISDRVADREKFEASHDSLVELLASKDRLIAAVSHELRTPLTSIYGYASLLVDEADSLPPNQRAEFYEVIAEQSSDISGIIEDLLVASRTDSEAIHVSQSTVDLAEMAREVIKRHHYEEKLQIEVSGEAGGLGDPLRLRQIMRNLVGNVVRHGGMRCRIAIHRGIRFATIAVSDDGEGVPPRSVNQIFDPFHIGANKENASAESIGIGLSVSLRLARLMGGDLRYRRQDGWTRFELTVPAVGDLGTSVETPAGTTPTADLEAVALPQSGYILEIGNSIVRTRTAGSAAVGCRGPGTGTCPLVEGEGCSLVDAAAGVLFTLDLDNEYNRSILRCYRQQLDQEIPIEVRIKPGDDLKYSAELVGTIPVIDTERQSGRSSQSTPGGP